MVDKNLIVGKGKKGYEVRAGKAYKKGEVICIARGKRTSPKTICYHGSNLRKGQIDPLQIGPETYLDLKKPFIYINHSCEPNAGLSGSVTLSALRNIKKGEEITYDYSTTLDESFFCKCGSRKCRDVVADFFSLPKTLQKSYISRGAVPRFIEKKYKKRHER